jgi:hypothetical protein
MNGFDFLYNFSNDDKELLELYNVELPEKISHAESIDLGKLELENGYIKLSVMFLPSEFWEAEIHSNVTGKTYKVDTGSGHLTGRWLKEVSYWEQMVNLVNGFEVKNDEMFEVKESL